MAPSIRPVGFTTMLLYMWGFWASWGMPGGFMCLAATPRRVTMKCGAWSMQTA